VNLFFYAVPPLLLLLRRRALAPGSHVTFSFALQPRSHFRGIDPLNLFLVEDLS